MRLFDGWPLAGLAWTSYIVRGTSYKRVSQWKCFMVLFCIVSFMFLLLARLVLVRTGQGGFLFIYSVSAMGGAFIFAVLTQTASPMVGASGALFGLAGAWQYWERRDLRNAGLSLMPIWRTFAALILLNMLL